MIGGERVNDRELKEKRLKKKRAAEQRLNALAKILAKVEDEEGPNLVLKVYDDIQEELKVKTDLLRKYKQKVSKVSEIFGYIFWRLDAKFWCRPEFGPSTDITKIWSEVGNRAGIEILHQHQR